MPNPKSQVYLFWIGFIGVSLSCFGCSLASQNQMRASQIFLIAAWLILVPLFGYLLRTRRRIKKIVRKQEVVQTAELDALGSLSRGITVGEHGPEHDEPQPPLN